MLTIHTEITYYINIAKSKNAYTAKKKLIPIAKQVFACESLHNDTL